MFLIVFACQMHLCCVRGMELQHKKHWAGIRLAMFVLLELFCWTCVPCGLYIQTVVQTVIQTVVKNCTDRTDREKGGST